MKFILFSLAVACSLYTIHAHAKPLTPADVSTEIDAKGADAGLQDGQWDKIMNHIGNGEKPWIDLIPKLPVTTDELGTDEISTSLAKALAHNAPVVLAILDDNSSAHQFPIKNLCAAPFFRPTKAYLITYKKQAISAVTAARASSPDKADRCLRQLEAIDPDKPWDPR